MEDKIKNKKGATGWTVGKLLTLIMAVILILLVIWGLSTGAFIPLKDRFIGLYDSFLITIGLGGGESGGGGQIVDPNSITSSPKGLLSDISYKGLNGITRRFYDNDPKSTKHTWFVWLKEDNKSDFNPETNPIQLVFAGDKGRSGLNLMIHKGIRWVARDYAQPIDFIWDASKDEVRFRSGGDKGDYAWAWGYEDVEKYFTLLDYEENGETIPEGEVSRGGFNYYSSEEYFEDEFRKKGLPNLNERDLDALYWITKAQGNPFYEDNEGNKWYPEWGGYFSKASLEGFVIAITSCAKKYSFFCVVMGDKGCEIGDSTLYNADILSKISGLAGSRLNYKVSWITSPYRVKKLFEDGSLEYNCIIPNPKDPHNLGLIHSKKICIRDGYKFCIKGTPQDKKKCVYESETVEEATCICPEDYYKGDEFEFYIGNEKWEFLYMATLQKTEYFTNIDKGGILATWLAGTVSYKPGTNYFLKGCYGKIDGGECREHVIKSGEIVSAERDKIAEQINKWGSEATMNLLGESKK